MLDVLDRYAIGSGTQGANYRHRDQPPSVRKASGFRNHELPSLYSQPALFITDRTAPRFTPVSDFWVVKGIGMSPHKIRQDRSLYEATATGGDVKRVCMLFGIAVDTAER